MTIETTTLRDEILARGTISELGGRLDGHILQNADELAAFILWYESLGLPRKYLEIGVQYGGMMRFMIDRGYQAYGIDPVPPIHVPAEKVHRGKSQDLASIKYAALHSPYGFVFIDGDHAYETVKADWHVYGMIAGVVALHDILGMRGQPGPKKLWDEIKYPSKREFISDHPEHRCGIGAILL